jgi:hypothetical protein
MKLRNKDILDMPLEKMDGMVDSFSKISESKVLTTGETLELKTQILSFGRAITKCGDGHVIPPEMKPIIKDFEKANFEISKLPLTLKNSLSSTYDDFKRLLANNSNEFNKTQAGLYCKIYEFFLNPVNVKFINRIQKDKSSKKLGLSGEDYSFESLEEWISDSESTEAFGSIAAIKSAFATLSSNITSTLLTVKSLAAIIAFLLILVAILLTTLVVINMQYKAELADILKRLSENKLNNDAAIYQAAKNMVDHTNPLTKNLYYKPVNGCLASFSKICDKGYQWFDKSLNSANSGKLEDDSKESLDPTKSEEILPGFVTSAVSVISKATIPFWIIFSLVLIMIFIKPAVYLVYKLRLKVSEFLKEESEMLKVNIFELQKQYEETTSEIEKARLDKIINKQIAVYNNMASFANKIYADQQVAAINSRDEIRIDDKIDYDKIVEENESVDDTTNSPVQDSSLDPINNTSDQTQKPRQSVVIF